MKEDRDNPNFKSYPVNISCMRIDDFLLSEHGNLLFNEILRLGDMDIFAIPTIEFIVEFIFNKLKNFLIIWRLPFFIAQIVVYFTIMKVHKEYDTMKLNPNHDWNDMEN